MGKDGFVQLHILGGIQHFGECFKADLPLKGGKVQIIAQNGKLEPGKQRVGGLLHPLADGLHVAQHQGIGVQLFLPEPIQTQAVPLMEQPGNFGGEPGGGHVCRPVQVQLHQLPGKVHGLLVGAQGSHGGDVAPEAALQAGGVHGNTHEKAPYNPYNL